jgi:hypothetical protein
LIKGPQEDKAGSSPAFFSPESFTGKYKVGDIVFVRALPWNDASHFEVDHIGVIGWRPISSHEWTKKGERKEDWVGDYVVEFINSDGFLDHDVVVEQGIEPYQGDLPEAQGFLKILSDHYLGKRKIRESLLQDLYESRIFVRKVRQFNEDCFEQETKA